MLIIHNVYVFLHVLCQEFVHLEVAVSLPRYVTTHCYCQNLPVEAFPWN